MQSLRAPSHFLRSNACQELFRSQKRQIHRGVQRLHQEQASSVDAADVKHHSSLAEDWWNVNGPVAPLHSLNEIRVPFIRDGLISTNRTNPANIKTAKPLENVKILEVGCGAGILTEQLARIHGNVTAIDPSGTLINVARSHLEIYPKGNDFTKRITYSQETIEAHVTRNEKYDAVVVSEVLEHVNDKEAFLKTCTSALAPGGSIFITTFNRTNIAWFGGIFMAEYILNMIPQGTHDWNKFISPLHTKRILEACGCTTVLCNGFLFEFWRKRWVWTRHHQFSYALQAVKT